MAENNTVNETLNESEEKNTDTEKKPPFPLKRSAFLAAICVAVAIFLVVVNLVTKDKIAENAKNAKMESIRTVFDMGTDCELYKNLEDGTEVYLVFRGEDIIGYCSFLSAEGYKGSIEMMVGINSEYKTEGVKIISMSETPDIASKINTPEFLGQFVGTSHSAPTQGVDAVSGATVSSEAIKSGVIAAHSVEIDLYAVAAERGCRLLTKADLETIVTDNGTESDSESVADSTEPTENTDPVSPDTIVNETDPVEETEDLPFVNNPGGQNYNYNVDATSVTDRYVLEIPKEEETATKETTTEPETTPAPVTTAPPVTTKSETIPPVTTPAVTTAPAETTAEAPAETTAETTAEETIPPWLA